MGTRYEMIDVARILLVHVGLIDVGQNVSLPDEATTCSRSARNQTFDGKRTMAARMKDNSNAARDGLIVVKTVCRMNLRVHLTWLGMWRRGAGSLGMMKSVLWLSSESLSAFDIYNIIETALKVMVLFWHLRGRSRVRRCKCRCIGGREMVVSMLRRRGMDVLPRALMKAIPVTLHIVMLKVLIGGLHVHWGRL